MKKLLCMAISLFLLGGCGRDASELTVVTGIGVDGQAGEYRVGAEVIRLTGGEQDSQSLLLSSDGKTVTDGIDRLSAITGRSLYCNHAQVLIIGRETAETSILPLLEELLRGNQYPISLRIAVAKETAEQTLKAKPTIGDLHSVELEDLIRQGAAQSLTADRNICQLYQEICAPGIEGVLPFIELRESNREPVCYLAGTALFRGERLLTVLSPQDSRCLMWMRGQSGGSFFTEHGLLEVIGLERNLEVGVQGGKLTLQVSLRVANSEEQKEVLMKQAEQIIKTQCESLIAALQGLNCDAIGFGQRLREAHPREWANLKQPWAQTFSSLPITVEVQAKQVIWGRIWSEQSTETGDDYGS